MDVLQTIYSFLHLSTPQPHLSRLDIFLSIVKIFISSIGTLVILSGVLVAGYRFLKAIFFVKAPLPNLPNIDYIRRDLGRVIILGLEFIIAADVIETTTTPTYYSVGILGIIVIIRTFLSYTLNREISQVSLLNEAQSKDQT